MLFKNVAISEKSEMHSFFEFGFVAMAVGLLVNVLYLSVLLIKEYNLSFGCSFAIAFVGTYLFYRCALSPNGFLNTYLKVWWYLANGGEKQKLKWYDKIMFVISILFSTIGFITIGYIFILMLSLVMTVF